MSEAKAMKLKEYGTSVISHDLAYATNSDTSNPIAIRLTDTFKSKIYEAAHQ